MSCQTHFFREGGGRGGGAGFGGGGGGVGGEGGGGGGRGRGSEAAFGGGPFGLVGAILVGGAGPPCPISDPGAPTPGTVSFIAFYTRLVNEVYAHCINPSSVRITGMCVVGTCFIVRQM